MGRTLPHHKADGAAPASSDRPDGTSSPQAASARGGRPYRDLTLTNGQAGLRSTSSFFPTTRPAGLTPSNEVYL